MIRVDPMQGADVLDLARRPEMAWIVGELPWSYGFDLVLAGPAYTFRAGRSVIACLGVIREVDGRGRAWAALSHGARPHMVTIVRHVRTWLRASTEFRRLSAEVMAGNDAGLRLARLLGFEPEGRARRFASDGSDAILYGWLRS